MASAHLSTAEFVRLVKAWDSGDVDSVRDLGRRLSTLSGALFSESNPTVIKGVLHAFGQIPTPHVRLPLLPASDESVARALEVYHS